MTPTSADAGPPPPDAAYDGFAERYADLGASRYAVLEIAHSFVLANLGHLAGQRLLDLGCGPGELSRRIAARGAAVTAIDQSSAMLRLAAKSQEPGVRWLQDDIQSLHKLPTAGWDIAVASLCLMDLPDHTAVFNTASRLLVKGGLMVWTVVHPCFGSPRSEALADDLGVLRERRVREYAATWWRSLRPNTVRGELGAFHRPLSDYLNAFIGAGFHIDRVAEPLVPPDAPLEADQESHRWLPPILGVRGTKT